MLKPVPRKSPSCMVSSIAQGRVSRYLKEEWWPGSESNQRHADFQSAALPTELPGRGAAHYKEALRVCTNRPGLTKTSKNTLGGNRRVIGITLIYWGRRNPAGEWS